MSDFNDFMDTLKTQIGDLAKSEWADFRKAATKDGKDFIQQSKSDLQRWTGQLANGELSKDEFESLVKGLKDLGEMKALTRAGLALVQADRFKAAVINTIIGTAFDKFI